MGSESHSQRVWWDGALAQLFAGANLPEESTSVVFDVRRGRGGGIGLELDKQRMDGPVELFVEALRVVAGDLCCI